MRKEMEQFFQKIRYYDDVDKMLQALMEADLPLEERVYCLILASCDNRRIINEHKYAKHTKRRFFKF